MFDHLNCFAKLLGMLHEGNMGTVKGIEAACLGDNIRTPRQPVDAGNVRSGPFAF